MKKSYLVFLILFYSQFSFAYWLGTEVRYGETKPFIKLLNEDKSVTFEPNPVNDLTLSMIGPSYSIGIQFVIEKEDDGDALESNYSDSRIAFYTDTYMAKLSFTSFEDFYVLDSLKEMKASKNYETLSGSILNISTLFYLDGAKLHEVHGEFVLSPKTGTGFFLNLSLDHGEISASKNLIPSKYSSQIEELASFDKFSFDSITSEVGVAGVYAWEEFYINGVFQIGPSFISQKISGDEDISSTMLSGLGEAMFGAAYYKPEYQFGIRSIYNYRRYQAQGAYIDMGNFVNYAYFTYLF